MSTAMRRAFVAFLGIAALAWAASSAPSAAQQAPPPPPPPPGLADPQLRCDDLSDPAERNACIDVRLRAARADHQRALERCRNLVPPGLRDDLVQDEASFAALLPARCDAEATGVDDQGLKTFVRSRCLEQALSDNTRGMLAAHPECAPPN